MALANGARAEQIRAVNMTGIHRSRWSKVTLLITAFAVAGCDGGPNFGAVGNFFGQNRGDAGSELPPPAPDSRGVITYATYQVIVAGQGDTISAMAARVGLSPEEVAAHNGLPVTYAPRPGEVLALPRDVGGTPATVEGWSPDVALSALDQTGPTTTTLPPAGGGTATENPFNNGQTGTVIDPIRHRVQAGETAFSIARLYNVSVTSLASWNGLGAEMALRENQELLIPVTGKRSAATAPAPAQPINEPGTPSVVPTPPSAQTPLPANQNLADAQNPVSPNLSADRTPPGVSRKFQAPIPGASVLRGYSPQGANKNEGIDFAASAGTAVKAAEEGEVALVSKSLGGLGTILLVRHANDILTVYGRITDVSLQKGDKVRRGQTLGVVAEGSPPNLHFEIRRGTESVDPGPYL